MNRFQVIDIAMLTLLSAHKRLISLLIEFPNDTILSSSIATKKWYYIEFQHSNQNDPVDDAAIEQVASDLTSFKGLPFLIQSVFILATTQRQSTPRHVHGWIWWSSR